MGTSHPGPSDPHYRGGPQTCMEAGLCCRHGGRGREAVTGPGGLLGTCSCQLCTNSPTSSVSFPAEKTSIVRGVGGQQGRGV